MSRKKRRCEIPARTLPPCDLKYGHEGDMHANAGDGFYAREYDAEHHRRQAGAGGKVPVRRCGEIHTLAKLNWRWSCGRPYGHPGICGEPEIRCTKCERLHDQCACPKSGSGGKETP